MAAADNISSSTPSGKRIKEAEGPLESGSVSRKRARLAPDVPQKPPLRRRSPEFYYDDGNIIVIVEDTEFRLHLSRLRRHCTYFSRLFELAAVGQENQNDVTLVDSNPGAREDDGREVIILPGEMNHVLGGISIADFTEFLRAYENPLMHVTVPPKQSICISLVRVADKLGCKTVSDVARSRLRKLWPLLVPQRTIDWKKKTLGETTAIIALAREFNLPEVLRRAFYELVRNPAFWETITTNRDSVKLADADLIALYHARHTLQQEWRTLLLTQPLPEASCLNSQRGKDRCAYTNVASRISAWRRLVVETGHLETGAVDPIYHIDVILAAVEFRDLAGTWCTLCITERNCVWAAAKSQWWGMLDELFKIPAAAGVASTANKWYVPGHLCVDAVFMNFCADPVRYGTLHKHIKAYVKLCPYRS
ncbi:uncharacterized protein TRAVEDRAFT_53922 [Trametes versicolor FP-101664 SS1]|uniref:BTB domain-containing protein n=1 Tax=Trametes versicolor (strain FP-101664) TaxID=717944 RepID=R7S7C0_TRAVS|nr:uncharacterized protein TRAVEDRAFT_53922 [Trametes versicolor FP-101664 SS1]EIW51928.1 hypothetical protein TRAVEDRAFT_53922 [Trametes versicolor FP-101664 SS1]